MLAHSHGQLWNASEIARSLGEGYRLTPKVEVLPLAQVRERLGKDSARRSRS